MAGTKKRVIVVQPRDLQLMRAMTVMRLIDREQARVVAGFRSVTRANARLLLLFQAGYLRRTFVGSVGCGRKAIYALTTSGALLIGIEPAMLKQPVGNIRQGQLYYEHQLKLNQIYLQLRGLREVTPSHQLLSWQTFSRPIVPNLPLIPDAYCLVETSSGNLACFIEADLGTETRRIWKQKVSVYYSLAVSGEFERHFHQKQFRVLVVTTSQRRIRHLQEVIRQQTEKMFFLISFEDLQRDGLLGAKWYRPRGNEPQSFS